MVANVGFLRTTTGRHLRAGPGRGDQEGDHRLARATWPSSSAQRRARCWPATPTRSSGSSVSAAAIKTELIARDPYEADLRRPLNFGHTIGHPLETVTGYGPLLHGEAVAFGMVVESRIAAAPRAARPSALLDADPRAPAPLRPADRAPRTSRPPSTPTPLLAAMEKVRLIRAGSLRYVLPVALGETVIADDVTEDEVRRALAACGVRRCDARWRQSD